MLEKCSVPKRFAWIVCRQSGATVYNCLRQLSIYTMLHAKFLAWIFCDTDRFDHFPTAPLSLPQHDKGHTS